MKLLKLSFFIIIVFISIYGCFSKKVLSEKSIVDNNIEVIFDIPKLLKMNIHQLKKNLGVPKSEFIPNEMQLSIDPNILSTLEYQNGTTTIQVDYLRNGEIKTIFISDNLKGRTKEDILKLGNLKIHSSEYKIIVKEWLNPDYARKSYKEDIAGIEVIPY